MQMYMLANNEDIRSMAPVFEHVKEPGQQMDNVIRGMYRGTRLGGGGAEESLG